MSIGERTGGWGGGGGGGRGLGGARGDGSGGPWSPPNGVVTSRPSVHLHHVLVGKHGNVNIASLLGEERDESHNGAIKIHTALVHKHKHMYMYMYKRVYMYTYKQVCVAFSYACFVAH